MAAYQSVAAAQQKVQSQFKPAGCLNRSGNDKLTK
jgi:hypothetical protein